jgi:hypothetical protein
MKQIIISISILLITVAIVAETKQSKEKLAPIRMNLHDFMEDYTKEAMKYFKKTGDRTYLTAIVKEIPRLTIEEQVEDWQNIVDKSLEEGKPELSCKACHKIYKKDYKKKYRKREITVPTPLLGMDKEIRSRR